MTDMRTGVCAVCDHREVVRAGAMEFGARGTSRPMAVTYDGKDGVYGFQPKLEEGHGRLRSYTCRSCGFTQWYADTPDKIPLNANMGTKLIKAK